MENSLLTLRETFVVVVPWEPLLSDTVQKVRGPNVDLSNFGPSAPQWS